MSLCREEFNDPVEGLLTVGGGVGVKRRYGLVLEIILLD